MKRRYLAANSHNHVCLSVKTFDRTLQTCVYLFGGLPVDLWTPLTTDMDHVRTWLLKSPLASPEHQLARYILGNLNWGYAGEVTLGGGGCRGGGGLLQGYNG